MSLMNHATLKLPNALEPLIINVWNRTSCGPISVIQRKQARFVDGRWIVDIYLCDWDAHLRVVKAGDNGSSDEIESQDFGPQRPGA